MKITYETWDGKYKGKPQMSKKLEDLIGKVVRKYTFGKDVHIVHAGTVGDARHQKDNPRSYHNHQPPDAIDVVKVILKNFDGTSTSMSMKTNDPCWRANRKKLDEVVVKEGGRCYHATDRTKNHLHVEAI